MSGMESTMLKETMENVKEKYRKVCKMLSDSDKLAPKNEPFKIKYEVIEILKEMEMDIKNVSNLSDTPTEEEDERSKMLAILYSSLGLVYNDTGEFQVSEEYFMTCIELLKGKEQDPGAIIPVLNSFNQLGIIWSKWCQLLRAKEILEKAEEVYNTYTDPSREYCEPICTYIYFGMEYDDGDDSRKPKKVLETIHTLTLYYLAQVYASLKDRHKSMVYCHRTLRRQLDPINTMQDLDHIEWALNAATISQFFVEKGGFTPARHHLAAASYVLQKYEDELKKESEDKGENEEVAAKWETFKHRSADVARCWAKYGILLLSLSKERLFQEIEKDEEDNEPEVKDDTEEEAIADLKFDVLQKDIEPIVNQITDKYLLDYNDARPVFLNVQKWLDQSKTYYTLESHASDHVFIVQDMSKAYKYLSFFEEQEDRQAKMHKRRINILEDVVKELNPQYYKSACRQMWIELGEIYSTILQIKIERLDATDEKPTPHALKKINSLAKSTIDNCNSFLNSIETHNSETEIKEFPEEVLQAALFSYFQLGRHYVKIITPDKKIQLENIQKSLDAYSFVVKYCEKYPKAAELIQVELSLCKDFVKLLPMKVDKLKQELAQQ